MRQRSRLLITLLALVTLAVPALAQQEGAEEQAQRLLAEGREYWKAGKLKQALDNFNIVINSFGGTEAVGDALLEIGRYRMEVDGDEDGAREITRHRLARSVLRRRAGRPPPAAAAAPPRPSHRRPRPARRW